MNVEVEIKVKIDNFEEIKKKVSTLGKLIKSINRSMITIFLVREIFLPINHNQ